MISSQRCLATDKVRSCEDHRRDIKLCLPAPSLSPPLALLSLPLSAHHWRHLSGGHPPFSRLNALDTVNILSAASPWDEQTQITVLMQRGEAREGE